jgi:transmembrane sensor
MKRNILLAANGRTAAKAAAYWAVLRDRQPLTADEEDMFTAWRADPAHDEAYRRASGAMAVFDGDRRSDPGVSALREAALDAAATPRTCFAQIAGAALAAGLAVAALFLPGGFLRPTPEPAVSSAPGPAWMTYATGRGDTRVLRLADGSSVTLDTDSQLAVALTGERRMVRLSHGRALFEVAHDGKRPFTVDAGDRRVTAVGTAFVVRTDPGRVDVVLVQGSVVVDRTVKTAESPKAEQPVTLKPGQKFDVQAGGLAEVSKVDVRRELLWRDGFVEFNGDSLTRAVAEINRYNIRSITLGDDGVAALHVSGLYRTGTDQFIEAIRAILPVQVTSSERDGFKVTLAPRGQP